MLEMTVKCFSELRKHEKGQYPALNIVVHESLGRMSVVKQSGGKQVWKQKFSKKRN